MCDPKVSTDEEVSKIVMYRDIAVPNSALLPWSVNYSVRGSWVRGLPWLDTAASAAEKSTLTCFAVPGYWSLVLFFVEVSLHDRS